jgi:aminotransferase
VLLPDPGYPDYPSGVAFAGATAVPLPLDPESFQPVWEGVTPAALAILNYPSNPCAVCEAPGTFETAVDWAATNGAWLMHDLAYGFLAFDGRRARSILEVPGARDVAVELWSPSKIYGMAGWRIGFAVGNRELIERVQLLTDHAAAGVFTGLQAGLVAALTSDQRDVAERAAVYQARRDRLVAKVPGLRVPEGTFYAWWQLPDGLTPETLIERAHVGVAPGEGFGARGAGWARMSLAVPDDVLDDAADRLSILLR